MYCENRGWLFEDLKHNIARFGAVASERPIPGYDAYISLRTRESHRSPKKKTVCQVHDVDTNPINGFGFISFVHSIQKETWESSGFKGDSFIMPIGTRNITVDPLPERPTIGFFCREVGNKKRSKMFAEAVIEAKKTADFDVLMIGSRLEKISRIGKYEERGATIEDYRRIDAIVTTSVSPMIPLSAYEALAAGRAVITTPRQWPMDSDAIFTSNTVEGIAEYIVTVCGDRKIYKTNVPFTRDNWAKEQVERAKCLVLQ